MTRRFLSRAVCTSVLVFVTVGAVALAVAVAVPGGAAAAKLPLECGAVNVPVPGSKVPLHYVDIGASGVTCRYIKTVFFRTSRPPAGWTLASSRSVGGRYPVEVVWRHGHDWISFRHACSGC
jgi:hypothetical protein